MALRMKAERETRNYKFELYIAEFDLTNSQFEFNFGLNTFRLSGKNCKMLRKNNLLSGKNI